MAQDTVFCIECGAINPLTAETCSQCQAELISPHPIQLDGGDVYSLKCEKCQAKLLVTDTEGFVHCDNCDTYHKIEKGNGYLTINAVSKINAKDTEAVLAAEDVNPMLLSTYEERLAEAQQTGQNRDVLMRRLIELEASMFQITKQQNKSHRGRTFGIILIPVGVVFFFILGMLTRSESSMNGGMLGFLGILSIIMIITGILVSIFAFTGRKKRKLDKDLAAVTAEAISIRQELDKFGGVAGGR